MIAGLLLSLVLLSAGIFLLVVRGYAALAFDWSNLLLHLALAVAVYGMVAGIGYLLNRRFEGAVARFLAGGPRESLHDKGLLRTFGLLLVTMLPLIVYLLLFALFATILFLGQGLALMEAASSVPVALPIALLIIALGTGYGTLLGFYYLLVPPEHRYFGLRVTEAAHKPLWNLIRETATRLKAKPIDSIIITPGPGIGVYQSGDAFLAIFGFGGRTLEIGLPSLHGLSVGEFGAILAHEYGHFTHRDTQWGAFTYVMGNSLLAALSATPGASDERDEGFNLVGWIVALNPGYWVLRILADLYFSCTMGFSRLREVMADLGAMDLHGAEAFAGGLRKVAMNDLVFAEVVHQKIADAVEEGKPIADFSGQLAEFYGRGDTPDFRRLNVKFLSEAEATGPRDSHPPLKVRLEYARRFPPSEGADSRPISALFDDWEGLNALASGLHNKRLQALLKAAEED